MRWAAMLMLGVLVTGAGTATAQTDMPATDLPATDLPAVDVPAAVVDSLTASREVPRPNAQAIDTEVVDLWDTGLSPTRAVIMTPLFPGWGQLYARNSWQAALGFGSEMYFWTNILVRDRRAVRANDFGESYPEGHPTRERYREIADENWEQMRDFAWWSGGVLLIIALDAYVGAHLFNFDVDPVPVPNRWDDAFGRVGDSLPGTGDGPSLVVFQWRKTF